MEIFHPSTSHPQSCSYVWQPASQERRWIAYHHSVAVSGHVSNCMMMADQVIFALVKVVTPTMLWIACICRYVHICVHRTKYICPTVSSRSWLALLSWFKVFETNKLDMNLLSSSTPLHTTRQATVLMRTGRDDDDETDSLFWDRQIISWLTSCPASTTIELTRTHTLIISRPSEIKPLCLIIMRRIYLCEDLTQMCRINWRERWSFPVKKINMKKTRFFRIVFEIIMVHRMSTRRRSFVLRNLTASLQQLIE